MTTPFSERLAEAVQRCGNAACVGLDPHPSALPAALGPRTDPAATASAARVFCLGAMDAVMDLVPVVKPQVAFFESLGSAGWAALEDVCAGARARGLLVLLDGKRGDIGSTAEAYAAGMLDDDGPLGADACTVSPYLGPESLEPFVARAAAGKGVFVLLRTSNPGAGIWQLHGEPSVADLIAGHVAQQNATRRGASGFGPIGVVVGGTLPAEIGRWRAALPDAWFLLPGVGFQGGSIDGVRPAFRADGLGALVVSARGVLFGADPDDDWQAGIERRCRDFVIPLRAAAG
jgi:orotidine-5'-phosphate decarboxylase